MKQSAARASLRLLVVQRHARMCSFLIEFCCYVKDEYVCLAHAASASVFKIKCKCFFSTMNQNYLFR